jgi:diketogulonate reductase-like aldo/keto reductase
VIERCEELGIAYLGHSPFQGSPQAFERHSPFVTIAAGHGVSPFQVIIAWHLLSPVVTVIAGARRPATIRDSAAGATLQLSPTDAEQIEATTAFEYQPHRS